MAKKGKTEEPKPAKTEKALATQAPKALAKAGGPKLTRRGFENLEMADILLPRVKLLQPLSPEVAEQGEKAGSIFLALSSKNYGAKVTITPIMHFRSRIKWNPRDDGGGIDCSSPDGRAPRDTKYANECSACPHKEWDDQAKNKKDKQPKCTLYDNFLVLIGDAKEPVLLPMEKTKMKAARKLYSMGALKSPSPNGDMWEFQYVLTTVLEKSSNDEPYFNYAVADSGKQTSEAQRKVAEGVWKAMAGKVISEQNQTPEEASPATPVAAGAGGKY